MDEKVEMMKRKILAVLEAERVRLLGLTKKERMFDVAVYAAAAMFFAYSVFSYPLTHAAVVAFGVLVYGLRCLLVGLLREARSIWTESEPKRSDKGS